jgi:class 3 adenylate cyclase
MRGYAKPTLLIVAAGCVLGVTYRYFFDLPDEASLANYLRSGVHAMMIAAFGWGSHLYFTNYASLWLRRWPILVEVALRALVMTTAIAIAITAFQGVLYGVIPSNWLREELPWLVALSFVFSALFGAVFELTRLIGGRVLLNVILGRYRHPAREERILMFLDIAGSTAIAEQLGEVRAQEFLTRFFFDVDDVIVAHGGEVHAYVGDEVIVSWPASPSVLDGDCLKVFYAVSDRIAERAASYQRDFGIVPRFRAALHVGALVISECGVSRRQIAFFGDTMNVTARLQTHCKEVGRELLVSADLARKVRPQPGITFTNLGPASLRGHSQPVEIYAVSRIESR